MAIYYLDIDDEITSAAARIRDSSDDRIALVLSSGSRVATSRINFRLLAREARQRNKRLAIITADMSVQSVARSAELPVYASVGEYERMEAAVARGGQGSRPDLTVTALDELAQTVVPKVTNARAAGAGVTRVSGAASGGDPRPRPRVSRPLLAGAALLAVLLVAAAGFFFYPSATITLTLREEPLGPMTVSVTIDPAVVAANDLTGTVPGLSAAFPVTASGTFDATGQTVVNTAASGTVTFLSINTIQAVPVIAGTQVTTPGGVAFTTTSTVSVPKATVSGSTITRGAVNVAVQAVVQGTAGNVAAGTIVRLPSDLAVFGISVTNRAATAGGTHTVIPQIQQSDISKAQDALTAELDANFQSALVSPAAVPSGATLFAGTAHLGTASCSPDPIGLLNQNVASFELQCAATGTATMADMTSVLALAERRARAAVRAGYAVVESSLTTKVGETVAQGSALVVPVTVQGLQVRNVSSDALRAEVVGKSLAEAKSILSPYGAVEISVLPDWSSTLPSFDFRIDLRLIAPAVEPSGSPPASGEPRPSAGPKATKQSTPGPGATPTSTAAPSGIPSASESPSPSPVPSVPPSPSESSPASPSPSVSPSPSPTAT